MSRYANDTVKESEAWRSSVSSRYDLLSIFFSFSERQIGISTIHQLLSVSTRQGPLCSSVATSGKVTRQSLVCHKLSEIIDACCCCCVPLSLSNDLFQSFTFNNAAELEEAIYLRLASRLSSRRSKASRYGIKYFCQKRFWSGFLAAIICSAWIKHEDDMGNTACSLRDSGIVPHAAVEPVWLSRSRWPWHLQNPHFEIWDTPKPVVKVLTWSDDTIFIKALNRLLSSALQKFNQREGAIKFPAF